MTNIFKTGNTTFSRASVEAALRRHAAAGNIAAWRIGRSSPEGRHSRAWPMYFVSLVGGFVVELTTVYEAHALVQGLASYELAQVFREQAEATRLAQEAAERAIRLAEQREVEDAATAEEPCESCGQQPGEKCLREAKDTTPYAQHPHKPRIDAYAASHAAELSDEPVAIPA